MFDKNVPNRDEVRKGCHLCGDGYAIMMSSLKWESQMIHADGLWEEVTNFEQWLEYNVEGNLVRFSRYGWLIYTSISNWHGMNQELSISLVKTVP